MKRLSFYLMIIGAIFTSCEPLEDIYTELDQVENPVVASTDYTLVADDYDDLDLSFGSFNSEDQAKDLLPAFLADKYPFYGEGSSVNVGYDLFRGNAEGVSDFTSSDIYSLTNDDYAAAGSNAFGFYPNTDATDQIPDILSAQISDAVDGQIVLAKYKQYLDTPIVGLANVFVGDFPNDFENFETVDVSGDIEAWGTGSSYAGASAFDGSANANEDWLISPEVDLSEESDLKFQITQRISFLNGNPLSDFINILVSTDYAGDGNVQAATWDTITLETVPPGDTSDFITSEDYDFSAYDGMKIYVAFKYVATDDVAPLWRIDNFSIKTVGVTGDTDSRGEYFMYDGSEWDEVDDIYFLSSEDFDSMGEGSGQPGRFNNFSSSVRPDNYLPQFLAIKYPFAQPDDSLFVIYDYFSSSSGAQRRGNVYTYNGTEWVGYESTISTSLQFGFENGMWVPDNTIRYTFAGSDYALIGEVLQNEPGFEAAASSAANFGNFDRRSGGSAAWSDEMMLRAIGIVLNNINPSAADGQKYIVTVDTFIGSSSTEDFRVIKEGGEWIYQ